MTFCLGGSLKQIQGSRPKGWDQVVVLCTTRFADLVPKSKTELLKLGELTDAEVSQLLG